MLTLIAAVDRNNAIGVTNGAPWHSPDDLEFFRRETLGGVLLIERDRYDELPPDFVFSGREVIVIDPARRPSPKGTVAFPAATHALKHCWSGTRSRVYVLGGEALYQELLPQADRVLISRAKPPIEEPAEHFPELPREEWKPTNNWITECLTVPLVMEFIRKR